MLKWCDATLNFYSECSVQYNMTSENEIISLEIYEPPSMETEATSYHCAAMWAAALVVVVVVGWWCGRFQETILVLFFLALLYPYTHLLLLLLLLRIRMGISPCVFPAVVTSESRQMYSTDKNT